MAIEVNSGQWTGEPEGGSPTDGPRLCAEFRDRQAADAALSRLQDRLPRDGGTERPVTATTDAPAPQMQPPDEHPVEAEARNLRQLGVGATTAAAAMAAAGVVVATGGAALPAVAAAAAAGGGTAAVGEALGLAADPTNAKGDGGRPAPAITRSEDGLTLRVHADTPEARTRAEAILRDCGAVRVWTEPTAAAG